MCVSCLLSHFSCVWLFATLWTVAHQVPRPWDSPSKNTGVGCHALLQGIFLTQGSNLNLLWLLHCRQILYHRATGEAQILDGGIIRSMREWKKVWLGTRLAGCSQPDLHRTLSGGMVCPLMGTHWNLFPWNLDHTGLWRQILVWVERDQILIPDSLFVKHTLESSILTSWNQNPIYNKEFWKQKKIFF